MSTQYDFKGKVAVVTGGARSIGLLTAQTLARRGAKVVIGDVLQMGAEAADQLNKELQDKVAIFQYCDVSNTDSLKALIDLAVSQFGRLDILVNNAGVLDRPWEQDPEGEYARRCIDINVRGLIDGTIYALHYWSQEEDRKGVVVNLASTAGYAPLSFLAAYAASKAAVVSYTKALAGLAPKIRVNAVAPSWVDTNLVDTEHIGRNHYSVTFSGLLQPRTVVEQIMRLIEDETMAGDIVIIRNNMEPVLCPAPKSTHIEMAIEAGIKENAAVKQE
ncbi:hypothetical protein GGI03_003551 [Coemansia sp. RSA 2337]|nr:hypothetical protein H4S04_001861 [Coemansia sp. S16]KAJ2343612.1 hypothetical protein GGH92_004840 [Coemansia sp. RSA 2673]KAJ2463913.1 hypothetical protein GGI03_003551 [Coemansia sp. RSA 2337]